MANYLKDYIEVTRELEKIISKETGLNVIICGEGGEIVAATLEERIGNVHGGAQKILSGEINEAAVTKEQEEEERKEGRDTRAGYNYFIEVDGKRIGSIGMTGDPEIVKPIVRVSSKTIGFYVTNYVRQREHIAHLNNIIEELQNGVHELSAASESVFAAMERLTETEQEINEVAQKTKAELDQVDKIIELLMQISKQTHMLGLNAAVEAARAGEHGLGFNVVAEEVRKLAKDSSNYSKKIEEVLLSFKSALEKVAEGVESNSSTAKQQSDAMEEVNEQVESVQKVINRIQQIAGEMKESV